MALSQNTMEGLKYECYKYGNHDRQRVGVWHRPTTQTEGCWIIYIHGGAWRDPRNGLEDFLPSIVQLITSTEIDHSKIRGFASIDYNLSPHPELYQDPAEVPTHKYRGAKHPDHILDIRTALKFLQPKIQLIDGYVLIGHSAGATLAYQAVMDQAALSNERETFEIPLPGAVLGISGIYDLVGLNSRLSNGAAGLDFIRGAFGSDEDEWIRASPARSNENLGNSWSGYSLLAYSPDDGLVDSPELEAMAKKLEADGLPFDVVTDLTGEHDFVWQQGSQMVRLVSKVLDHI